MLFFFICLFVCLCPIQFRGAWWNFCRLSLGFEHIIKCVARTRALSVYSYCDQLGLWTGLFIMRTWLNMCNFVLLVRAIDVWKLKCVCPCTMVNKSIWLLLPFSCVPLHGRYYCRGCSCLCTAEIKMRICKVIREKRSTAAAAATTRRDVHCGIFAQFGYDYCLHLEWSPIFTQTHHNISLSLSFNFYSQDDCQWILCSATAAVQFRIF